MSIKKLAGVLTAAVLALTACGDAPDEATNGDSAAEGYASSVELDPSYDPDAEIAFAWPLEATSWDPHQGSMRSRAGRCLPERSSPAAP